MTHDEYMSVVAACRQRDDECWEWSRARNIRGYGNVVYGGKATGAHRVMASIAHGLDLSDPTQHALHRCDNPPCVNPAHLFVGTSSDNMADMDAKGRRGARPRKLTVEQMANARVRRTQGASIYDLAAEFGVSTMAIRRIPDLGPQGKRPDPEPWRPSSEHLERMAANLAAVKAGEPLLYATPYAC